MINFKAKRTETSALTQNNIWFQRSATANQTPYLWFLWWCNFWEKCQKMYIPECSKEHLAVRFHKKCTWIYLQSHNIRIKSGLANLSDSACPWGFWKAK